ncbi:MAG: hypothetical protein K8S98_18670 [Planctomycetes bacterium]|nr:hypothetical protein [Planctomycetota bacterium]
MRSYVLFLWIFLALASVAHATGDDVCPYCKNDPSSMQACGLVTHAPTTIGLGTPAEFAAKLVGPKWIFAETAHLRIAFAPGASSVDQADRKSIDAELDLLRKVLPTVPSKPKRLDPYLRLHLIALRSEKLYARVQTILRVTDADFPEKREAGKPYMGNGKFLGEKDKFELVIHATNATHKLFTRELAGIEVTDSFRWHVPDVHKMLVSIPAEDPFLKSDRWLFTRIAHNLAHLFFCAYKHFSFEPPPWLDEGLALVLEKEIEIDAQTLEREEGGIPRDYTSPDPWSAVRKLALSGKSNGLADLMYAKNHAELTPERALIAWSMVRFLIDEKGEEFAGFVADVKGQLDAAGLPTGANLVDLQREKLRERFRWTPQQFDEAWKAWVTRKR